MRRLVLDASVIVKWLVGSSRPEPDADRAALIFEEVKRGALQPIQPPHWLAEVSGVLARLSPGTAEADVADLVALELEVVASEEVYRLATRLAIDLDHHVLDTLYHAVALNTADAELVTADDRYYRRTRHLGAIRRLADWRGLET